VVIEENWRVREALVDVDGARTQRCLEEDNGDALTVEAIALCWILIREGIMKLMVGLIWKRVRRERTKCNIILIN
jgi:hypothetical protein